MQNRAIIRQAKELKEKVKKDRRQDENFLVGIEIEGCLIGKNGLPVDAKPLIQKMQGTRHEMDFEYSRCQFEFKTRPVSMDNLQEINDQLEDFSEAIGKSVQKIYHSDVFPLFLGANPSPAILDDAWLTGKPRYKKLGKWQSGFPDVEMEGQKYKALHVAYGIQGFHFHLQGKDPSYTAAMFNHILNLIPSAILLCANSRLFAGKVFAIHEPRIFMYDQSEQQNSGFPAIPRYLGGVEDYIDYIVSRKPVIAKNYFEMVKERHDDARIRMNTGNYRVETRVLSVQPTPRTMMAIIEFFVGYLYRAIHEKRKLRPLSALREERQSVVRSGFNAKTHFSVIDTARNHLSYARKGLSDLGVGSKFLSILDSRLEKKVTAGDYVADLWYKNFNGSVDKTVAEIAEIVWQKTLHNSPIA